ncbi:MAG: hypothetical protein ACM3NQ_11915 [Bacteroidales bacterium]
MFIITAALYCPQAVVTLVTPTTSLSMYGVVFGPGAVYMARWAGVGSLVIGLLAWFARDLAPSEGRRVVERTLLAYFVVAGVLSLSGVLSGEMSSTGWALVAINTLFVSAHGLVLAREPQRVTSAPAER